MTKPFDYLVHKRWCQDFSFWWHWQFHWHEYLHLRNGLSILSKWHTFAGYPLGFAVCTNCSERCTNCCANVNSDVRKAPMQLRKTVTDICLCSRTKYWQLFFLQTTVCTCDSSILTFIQNMSYHIHVHDQLCFNICKCDTTGYTV